MKNLKLEQIMKNINTIIFLDSEGNEIDKIKSPYPNDFIIDVYGIDFQRGNNDYKIEVERLGNQKILNIERCDFSTLRVVIEFLLKNFYNVKKVLKSFEFKEIEIKLEDLFLNFEDKILATIYLKEIENRVKWKVARLNEERFDNLLNKINQEISIFHTVLKPTGDPRFKIENNLIKTSFLHTQENIIENFTGNNIFTRLQDFLKNAYPSL